MRDRYVAVLGGGQDSLGILTRIKRMGLKTIVFDGNKRAPARKYLADHFVGISCYDPWHVLHYLKLQTAVTFDAVLCAGTDCPDVMAIVAKERGLVGPKARTAEISMNKLLQDQIFKEAGINTSRRISNPQQYPVAPYNVVVKPVSNRGARGVMQVVEGERLQPAIDYALGFSKQAIVEQWMEGIQLSSESLVQDGKILWTAFSERNYDKLDEFYPYVIENGGDMPPDIAAYPVWDWEEIAEAQLQKCVAAMGLKHGTLKGDLVWDGYKIWVVEVACRLSGGQFCSAQIPNVWGIDFVGMATRIALGEHIYEGEIRPYLRRHMSQRFDFPVKPTCHPERGKSYIGFGADRKQAQKNARRRMI